MDIEILQEERLRYWCNRIDMPQGAIDALAEMARDIQADPDLLNKFTDFYDQTTLQGGWMGEGGELPAFPIVQEKLTTRASLFFLLGYLAALPKVEREYRRLGVSLDIFHDTMLDFSIWVNQAYDLHGYWNFNQFAWMALHVSCKLFRLGRLEYMLGSFRGNITAFRHRVTRSILLLGDPSMPLRADGYAEGAGGTPAVEGETWHAVFETTPAGWRGSRINPMGFTLREESFLLRSEWERILKHGDTILDLHIPRGDKLTVKECRESIQAAYKFFPAIFPDRPFKGLYCHTWFFTPQLQKILPLESNIVRFQREFYLYPQPGGPGFMWSYVFGEKYPDATTAPRDTSLRRAVLDWMAEGNEVFDLPGLMLHTPEQWGSQPYYNIPAQMQYEAPVIEPLKERPAFPVFKTVEELEMEAESQEDEETDLYPYGTSTFETETLEIDDEQEISDDLEEKSEEDNDTSSGTDDMQDEE